MVMILLLKLAILPTSVKKKSTNFTAISMRLDTEFYLFKIEKIRMAIVDQMEALSGLVSFFQQWLKSDKDGEEEEQAKNMRLFSTFSISLQFFLSSRLLPD